jgi:hypothetical protein
LRTICAQLQEAAKSKFKGDDLVRFTAPSAFIFLRFICPAILNPKLFNMMPDHPTETTARNLTLVAKILQNLANMSEFGQKEPHMTCCNEFIMLMRGRMQKFLDSFSTASPSTTNAVALTARAMANIYRFLSNADAAQLAKHQKELMAKRPSLKTLDDVASKIKTALSKA